MVLDVRRFVVLSADRQRDAIKSLDPKKKDRRPDGKAGPSEVRVFLNAFLRWSRQYTVHPDDNAWVNGILAALLRRENALAYRGSDVVRRRNVRPFWLWARVVFDPRNTPLVGHLSTTQHDALDERFLTWAESGPFVLHAGWMQRLFSLPDREAMPHVVAWLESQPETQPQQPEPTNDRDSRQQPAA